MRSRKQCGKYPFIAVRKSRVGNSYFRRSGSLGPTLSAAFSVASWASSKSTDRRSKFAEFLTELSCISGSGVTMTGPRRKLASKSDEALNFDEWGGGGTWGTPIRFKSFNTVVELLRAINTSCVFTSRSRFTSCTLLIEAGFSNVCGSFGSPAHPQYLRRCRSSNCPCLRWRAEVKTSGKARPVLAVALTVTCSQRFWIALSTQISVTRSEPSDPAPR